MFWSQSSVYFNNWGGVLRIQGNGNCDSAAETECNFYEEIVIPGATYDGPSFDGSQGCCGDASGNGSAPTSLLNMVGTYKITSDNGTFRDYYAVITATDDNNGTLFEIESSDEAGTNFSSCDFSITSTITTTGNGIFTVTDTASTDITPTYDFSLTSAGTDGQVMFHVESDDPEPSSWQIDNNPPPLATGCN